MENPPHLVRHLYIIHYHQKQKYSTQVYIFKAKTTNTDNKYELHSRACEDTSYMIQEFYFTVSYAPVFGITSLCIIITTTSTEGLTILSWTYPMPS